METTPWTAVTEELRTQVTQATTVAEMHEALHRALTALAQQEQAVFQAEQDAFRTWEQERTQWIKGYQQIFAVLPALRAGMHEVIASLQEDEGFQQAPAAVQERLQNRKEGLTIISRMVERLPSRQEGLDTLVTEDIAPLESLDLSAYTEHTSLASLTDLQAVSGKIEEIIGAVAEAEDKVREDNYQRTRELRLQTEKLKQAVLGFLRDYLLPVIDGLERGLWDEKALREPLNAYPEAQELIAHWFGAYQRCYQLWHNFLPQGGLDRVPVTRGAVFDPQWHLALGQETCAELTNDQIAEVVRSGWNFHGYLVRAAEVVVARNEEGKEDGQEGFERTL
jgi:molecular chaperone GrpE (heat shock protein)